MTYENRHFALAEVLHEACRSHIKKCEILDADDVHVNLQISHGYITTFANGNYAYTVITNRQFEDPVSALDTLQRLHSEVIDDFELAKSLVSKANIPEQSPLHLKDETAEPIPVKPDRNYPGKALLDAVHEVVEAISELSASQDLFAQFIAETMHKAEFGDFVGTEVVKHARELAKHLDNASNVLAEACAKERQSAGQART